MKENILTIIIFAHYSLGCVVYRLAQESAYSKVVLPQKSHVQYSPEIQISLHSQTQVPHLQGIKLSDMEPPCPMAVVEMPYPTLTHMKFVVTIINMLQRNPVPHLLTESSMLLIVIDKKRAANVLGSDSETLLNFPYPEAFHPVFGSDAGFVYTPQIVIVDIMSTAKDFMVVCYTCESSTKVQKVPSHINGLETIFHYSEKLNSDGRGASGWAQDAFADGSGSVSIKHGWNIPECAADGPQRKPMICFTAHSELRMVAKNLNVSLKLSEETDNSGRYRLPGLHIDCVSIAEGMTTPALGRNIWYNPYTGSYPPASMQLFYCRKSAAFEAPSWLTMVMAFDVSTWILLVASYATTLSLSQVIKYVCSSFPTRITKSITARHFLILFPFTAFGHFLLLSLYEAESTTEIITPLEETRMKTVDNWVHGSKYRFLVDFDVHDKQMLQGVKQSLRFFADVPENQLPRLLLQEPKYNLLHWIANPLHLTSRATQLKGVILLPFVGTPGGDKPFDPFFSLDSKGELRCRIGSYTCYYLKGKGSPHLLTALYRFQMAHAKRAWEVYNSLFESGFTPLFLKWVYMHAANSMFKHVDPNEIDAGRDWYPMPLIGSRLRSVFEIFGALMSTCILVFLMEKRYRSKLGSIVRSSDGNEA